ncbi:hypothetical protein DM01DRAFT_1060763 [Hesseltinella vesiculosa]|uniref:Transmembrane protein n=1 Tax=Hesseltinella vesiculosa TaxID=101127 RepID=A0A1X2GF39_9FUNG|nr:hypothetical protein DM01DRAFT_1060763 [Hesseltinella vesiculosa]
MDTSLSNTDPGSTSSAMIITFEVVFSVAIFLVVAGCYVFGIQQRKRRHKVNMDQYDAMVERALTRHDQTLMRHMRRHSSTISIDTTHLIPPPSYQTAVNNPVNRLNDRDVHRLSQALLTTHLARSMDLASPLSPATNPDNPQCVLPDYDGLRKQVPFFQQDHPSPPHQEERINDDPSPLAIPPLAITRPVSTEQSSIPSIHSQTHSG